MRFYQMCQVHPAILFTLEREQGMLMCAQHHPLTGNKQPEQFKFTVKYRFLPDVLPLRRYLEVMLFHEIVFQFDPGVPIVSKQVLLIGDMSVNVVGLLRSIMQTQADAASWEYVRVRAACWRVD